MCIRDRFRDARDRSRQADFRVEFVDQPVEDDDLLLEELAPVLGVPLGLDLLVGLPLLLDPGVVLQVVDRLAVRIGQLLEVCLLYTSDAADERSSVDLGGRPILKKKKNKQSSRRWRMHRRNDR